MIKYYSNPKYTEQLVSHYTAKNNLVKSSDSNASLSPQDQVLEFRMEFPNSTCCPVSASTTSPSGSIVLSVVSGSAVLSWVFNSNVFNQQGFNVEKSLTGSGLSFNNIAVISIPTQLGYTDTAVFVGNTYWYRVNAWNNVGVSAYSNEASISFAAPPGPPLTPINLTVISGSAILNWNSSSNDQNYFTVQRALTGSGGGYSELSTSVVITYTDHSVTSSLLGQTYWYKVAAINTHGTSSFSNTASITFTLFPNPFVSTCIAPWFQAYTQSLYSLPFETIGGITSSYTQSLTGQKVALWARSIIVDPNIVAIVNPAGQNVGNDDTDGWNPPEDGYSYDNAAINFNAALSGTYQFQLGSWTGEQGVSDSGSMSLYISPGPEYKASWQGANPSNIYYISSSKMIGVAQNYGGGGPSGYVIWYNVSSSTITQKIGFSQGCFGAAYSPIQDRVFVMPAGDTHTTNSIFEYNNTGTLITSYSLDAQLGSGFTWTGFKEVSYDNFNDRLFLLQENFSSPRYAVWSCASRNVVHSGSLPGFTSAASSFSTYVNVLNRYYIGGPGPTSPMMWVDAVTYVSGTTATHAGNQIQYEPVTQIIGGTNFVQSGGTPGGVVLIDPVSDTVVRQVTTKSVFGTPGGIFEGIAFDPCTQTVVVDWDMSTGITGLPVMASSQSFSASNFIPVVGPNDPSVGSASINATWGLVYSATDSKMYIASVFLDSLSNVSCSLWSAKITGMISQSKQPPFSILLSATGSTDFTVTSVPTLESPSASLGYGPGGSLSQFSLNAPANRALISDSTGSFGKTFVVATDTMTVTSSITRSFVSNEPTACFPSGSSFYFVDTFGAQTNLIQVDSNGNFVASKLVDPISSSNFYSIGGLGGKLWIPHVGGNANTHTWVSVLNPNNLNIDAEFELATRSFSAQSVIHTVEDSTRGYSYIYVSSIAANSALAVFTASTSPSITASKVGFVTFAGSDWEDGFAYATTTGKVYLSTFLSPTYQIYEVNPVTLTTDYIYSMNTILGNGNIRPTKLDYNAKNNILQFYYKGFAYAFNPVSRTFLYSASYDPNINNAYSQIQTDQATGESYTFYPALGASTVTGSFVKFTAPIENVVSESILNWSASSMQDITYFQLQRSLDGNSWVNYALTFPPTETYLDTNITGSVSGSTYWYRVNGVKLLMSTSSLSNTASLTFFTQPVVPQSLCVAAPFQSTLLTGSIQAPITTSLISH